MQKYYEDKKILLVAEVEGKLTPGGNAMVKVTFDDGTVKEISKLRYELIATDQPSDATAANKQLVNAVGSMLYGLLMEYAIEIGEVNAIADSMVGFVNNGFEKADSALWKQDKIHIGLLSINEVLMNNGKDNNGTSSAGSAADTSAQG